MTREKIAGLEKRLEECDRELDSITQTYYTTLGGQNVGGNMGKLSQLHAQLVEQLAEEKRKMTKGERVE